VEGEPIEARRVNEFERLWMLARRHRNAAVFLMMFLVALATGTAVSTAFAIRATRERDRAMTAERDAKAATERATTEAEIATAVKDFLQKDLLDQASEYKQAKLGRKPELDIRVRTLLDRAAAAVEGKFPGNPTVEVAIRRTIGETYLSLLANAVGKVHLERALALARQKLGDRHPETLTTILSLAMACRAGGDYANGELLAAQAFRGLRGIKGNEHPDTLAAMEYLGNTLIDRGKLLESESLLVEALNTARRVLGENHSTAIWIMADLGRAYNAHGKFGEGERLLSEALELARRAPDKNHMLPELMAHLETDYILQDKYAQARELADQFKAATRSVFGEGKSSNAPAIASRGRLLSTMGQTDKAQTFLATALEASNNVGGRENVYRCWAKMLLAETYQAQRKVAVAEVLYAEALAGWRRSVGDNHWTTLHALNPLAELYLDGGWPEKAEPLLIEAEKAGAGLGDQGYYVADTASAIVRLRLMQRKPSEAEPAARRALAIRMVCGPDHWTRFDALSLLGGALAGQKRYAEAEPLLIQGYEGLKAREARTPFLWRKKRQAQAGERIVALYKTWGKKDKADEWRTKLALPQELPADPFRR
jgi:tetratricopeptide (TPR) repeat protein